MEACEVCGFEWDAVGAAEVVVRLRSVSSGFGPVLGRNLELTRVRPDPQTWSALEYGAHVRDVLLNLRDRIVLGLAEDNPTPHRMFADVRVDLGLYVADEPSTVVSEIDLAADLLARLVEVLSPEQLARPIFYPYPVPATRTLLWVAAQALHEAEHHLADARSLVPSPPGNFEIRLTGPATDDAPQLVLTMTTPPVGFGFVPAVCISFADGSGGGGGDSHVFDPPYTERMIDESTGRAWAFGVVPKGCTSVSVGARTRPVIVAENLSSLDGFVIETTGDDSGTITFHHDDGTSRERRLPSLDG